MIHSAALFGSRATGLYKPYLDIDLVIYYDTGIQWDATNSTLLREVMSKQFGMTAEEMGMTVWGRAVRVEWYPETQSNHQSMLNYPAKVTSGIYLDFVSKHLANYKLTLALPLLISLSVCAWAQYPGAAPEGWPCVQRYVPEVSPGIFWTGELPDPGLWQADGDLTVLADKLMDRATPMSATDGKIADYFASRSSRGDDQTTAAKLLIGALTDAANRRRDSVHKGIKRFSDRQQMMITRIDEQSMKLAELDDTQNNAAEREDLQARQAWDIRVFEEREQLSIVLCEQSVLLEQRFFALGRNVLTYMEEERQ